MENFNNARVIHMFSKKDLNRIDEYVWEIPRSFRRDMRVPARVYISEKMLDDALKDKSLDQLVNTCALPGVTRHNLAMPDVHQGFGMPIGGVLATKIPEGAISPGAIGFDENCGVRLLRTELQQQEVAPVLSELISEMQGQIPSGLGKGRKTKFSGSQIDKILEQGVPYLVSRGYGEEEDVENCEEKGRMETADADCVSDKAKRRGADQVGTLGSGNHFCEIDVVEKVFDAEVADSFGLFKNQIAVLIHTGSRGLGHQNCQD